MAFELSEKCQLCYILIKIHYLNENLKIMNAIHEILNLNQAIIDTIHEPLIVMGSNLDILFANPRYYSFFKESPSETINHKINDIGNKQWDIPELIKKLHDTVKNETPIESYVLSQTFNTIGYKYLSLNARKVIKPENGDDLILLAINDITEQKLVEKRNQELLIAQERLEVFHSTMNTVTDIINNTLHSFQYINSVAKNCENIDKEMLEKISEKIQETSGKLKKLTDTNTIPTQKSPFGTFIDFE